MKDYDYYYASKKACLKAISDYKNKMKNFVLVSKNQIKLFQSDDDERCFNKLKEQYSRILNLENTIKYHK